MRKYITGIVIGVLLSSAVVVLAGNLNPLSGPTDPASQMVTLEQIYNRLHDGAAESKMISFTEPLAGPGAGTMHTLDDIMAIAPAADNTDGALPAEVLTGRTYWGLRTGGTWGNRTGTRPPAPVPKTGQTKKHAVGDDGDLEEGVAWPNPRFTDNGDGTVTDNLTGLIWLKKANCPNAARDWATALITDVTQLNTNGQMNGNNCGDTSNGGSHQTDWRLPNVRELYSLIDFSQVNNGSTPALPTGHPFDFAGVDLWSTPAAWSSTTFTADDEQAFAVDIDVGHVRARFKTTGWIVWPVR